MKNKATVSAKESEAKLQPEKTLKQRKKENVEKLKRMTICDLKHDAVWHSCPQNDYPFYPLPVWPDYIAKAFDDKIPSDRERAYLAICQRIVRQERSFLRTPIETFICKLLHHLHNDELDLRAVNNYVKQLETNWNQAVEIATKLKREYLYVRIAN